MGREWGRGNILDHGLRKLPMGWSGMGFEQVMMVPMV